MLIFKFIVVRNLSGKIHIIIFLNCVIMKKDMARLEFESLEFKDIGDKIEVSLLRNFFFHLRKEDLNSIGSFKIGKNFIEFKDVEEKRASSEFNSLIAEGIKNLKNKPNGKPAVYIHRNSGIPLIGSLFFGIVDRGTSIIEIKPLTSCNINCIFCSVDEGISSRKRADFVVEEEYIIEEMKKLIEYKQDGDNNQKIEIFINPHGEPLLYADIARLVKDLKKMKQVSKVSIATNGSLLTKELADELDGAGLDSINLSINSLDEKNARIMAGTKEYDIKKIKNMIDYISSKTKIKMVIAPVWIKGMNDKDIEDVIDYCKEKGFEIGIQKYVRHKKGRNPENAEDVEWGKFFENIQALQDKHDSKLVYPCSPAKTRELPKPFSTGDTISAVIVSEGRYSDEKIAAAKERVITVYSCRNNKNIGNSVRIRIIKSKDNIFFGKCI